MFGALNQAAGGRFGRPLPGVGDQAWLANADRTGIVRVGDHTVKLTVTGLPEPERAEALGPLLSLVAGRLAQAGQTRPFSGDAPPPAG